MEDGNSYNQIHGRRSYRICRRFEKDEDQFRSRKKETVKLKIASKNESNYSLFRE